MDAGEEIMVVLCVLFACLTIDSIFEKYFNYRLLKTRAESDTYEAELDDDQES